MPRMMRMTAAVVFALFVGACSFGGSGNGGGGGGGGGGGDVDASVALCGDGVCAASEVGSCTADCGGGGTQAVCGNGQCETTTGETAQSCPSDCGGGGGGAVCGNGTCEATENSTSCPSDCGGGGGGSGNLDCNDPNVQIACFSCLLTMQCQGVDEASCTACLGGGGGSALGCVGGVPNGMCDPGEDANNCPFDCM